MSAKRVRIMVEPGAVQRDNRAWWPRAGSSLGGLAPFFGTLFLASVATFVQTFAFLKLLLLGLFLGVAVLAVVLRKRQVVYPRLIWFYTFLGAVGVGWAIVGLLRPGNYFVGVTDAVRLYVVWSAAFLVILSLLRATASLRAVHRALVTAGILIALINAIGVADQFAGWGIIGAGIREEMFLSAGILDGYVRINSINIGSLFLIVPYLLTAQFVSGPGYERSAVSKVSLLLSLIVVAASGRRALWLVVLMTPATILAVAHLSGTYRLIPPARRYALGLYLLALAAVPIAAPAFVPGLRDLGAIQHIGAAFSSEDERSIQSGYLVGGWAREPILGSGFGAYAGYKRNELRPWSYELTYHRMLYNLGLVGTAILVAVFGYFFMVTFAGLRRSRDPTGIQVALCVGLISLLIGAYSNPYLGSFDYLIFLGLLPYLSTRPPDEA